MTPAQTPPPPKDTSTKRVSTQKERSKKHSKARAHAQHQSRVAPSWKITAAVGATLGLMIFIVFVLVIASVPAGANGDTRLREGLETVLLVIPLAPLLALFELINIHPSKQIQLLFSAICYAIYGCVFNMLFTRWAPFYSMLRKR